METQIPPELPTEVKTKQWYFEQAGRKNGPISEREIKAMLDSKTVSRSTLVWSSGLNNWIKLEDSELSQLISSPPPLTGNKVNNAIVWIIALAPIWVIMLMAIFDLGYFFAVNDIPEIAVWFVVNTTLVALDAYLLKRMGYENNLGWGLLLIPVYLWMRSDATKQSKAYFWVWIVAMIFSCSPGFMNGLLQGLKS